MNNYQLTLRLLYTRLSPFLQLTAKQCHSTRYRLSYARHFSADNYSNEGNSTFKVSHPSIESFNVELTKATKPSVDKKEQFSVAIDQFKRQEKYRKGHVELVKVALTHMDRLKLEKDVDVYNKIITIFPEGRFAPKRMLDALWPRSIPQLELSLEILTKMEENGVRPNQETYDLLNIIFGKMSLPVQKCIRIAYWFDKYEFVDPYKVYDGELPSDPVALSQFILNRITAKKGAITIHKESGAGDARSYIVSAVTDVQSSLLQSDFTDALLHVEGPHRLWQHSLEQFYYTLRLTGSSRLDSLLHEDMVEEVKKEGTVLSVCMCFPGSQETLEEWMEDMFSEYPNLTRARVVYDIKETDLDNETKRLASTRTKLLEENLD